MKIVFQDSQFSFQLLRAIGQAVYGNADIEGCLSTAYRIKEGEFECWYVEWLKTAEEHCQMGAMAISHQRIFDWLDKTFVEIAGEPS